MILKLWNLNEKCTMKNQKMDVYKDFEVIRTNWDIGCVVMITKEG